MAVQPPPGYFFPPIMRISYSDIQGLAALVIILSLSPSNQILAREWYALPSVSIGLAYDDNIRLTREGNDPTPEDNDAVFGRLYGAQAELGTRTENSNVNLNLRTDISRYSGQENLDTNNWLVALESFYTFNPRNTFSISGSFVGDTSLTSEFDDTGRVQDRKPRRSISVFPRWTHSLSERSSLQAGYSYNDVRYKNAGDTALFDFSSQSADLGYFYTLDDSTTNISATIGASRFETPSLDSKTNNYSLQFRADHEFSSVTSGSLSIGPRVTQEQFLENGNEKNTTSTGFAGEVSLAREFYSDRLNAALSREVRPSGSGSTQETDRLSLNWFHEVTSRLDFSLGASVSRNKSTSDDLSASDRIAFSVGPRLNYQLSPEWKIDGGYLYRRQKFSGGGDGDTAESNAVSISVGYQWPRIATSR